MNISAARTHMQYIPEFQSDSNGRIWSIHTYFDMLTYCTAGTLKLNNHPGSFLPHVHHMASGYVGAPQFRMSHCMTTTNSTHMTILQTTVCLFVWHSIAESVIIYANTVHLYHACALCRNGLCYQTAYNTALTYLLIRHKNADKIPTWSPSLRTSNGGDLR